MLVSGRAPHDQGASIISFTMSYDIQWFKGTRGGLAILTILTYLQSYLLI